MHEPVRHFVQSVKVKHPRYFQDVSVIEFGSLNINGTVRDYFVNCRYTGVDLGPGNGVDAISLTHEYQSRKVDTIISTEMLEHDQFWYLSLRHMIKLLKPFGMLIITAGGKGRPEHGTTKCGPGCSPLTVQRPIWKDYYRNIGITELDYGLNMDANFNEMELRIGQGDIYFWGILRMNNVLLA